MRKPFYYLSLGFIACLYLPIPHEWVKSSYERLRIDYDVQECIRNLLRIKHDFSNRGIRGKIFEQLKTFEELRIARTDYGLYDSVKIFTNWERFSHESKYLSIHGNSWDSGAVWNRGMRQKSVRKWTSTFSFIYSERHQLHTISHLFAWRCSYITCIGKCVFLPFKTPFWAIWNTVLPSKKLCSGSLPIKCDIYKIKLLFDSLLNYWLKNTRTQS